MKRIVALLAVVFTVAALTLAACADTFNGTMVRPNNADPNLFFHNGKYYMTQTGTSRIAIFETEHVDELATLTLSKNISYTAYLNGKVYDPTVTELFGEGAAINGTWSPELHYFSEEQFPGKSGWYMFLGLRKNTGDSSMVRMVVLKSMTDSPKGPYGHPTKGTANYSQPVLDTNGNVWDEWACGQTTLTIPEGPYKGTYAMWVAEEGRGQSGSSGKFYQKIMIAKMKSPWQLDGEPGIVTTPTQPWEYAGASSTHPRVVEGATPVYGKNGEVFITYSGSGYWSDYGLGQLTWNGGDPLETSSWVKLPVANGNPIFTATTAENLRGAGHASFLTDTDGNGYICYHAYKYDYVYDEETQTWSETKVKASSRDAYIEPYYIDYTKYNGVSYGVITIGLDKNGVAADTASKVTFATDGEYLTAPEVVANADTAITLTMSESGANGYIVYKSTDGEVFDYLTTVDANTYTDSDVEIDSTYYYRVYAYREEEISDVSETVSATTIANVVLPEITALEQSGSKVNITVVANDNYDFVNIYHSTDGNNYSRVRTVTTALTKPGDTYTVSIDVAVEGINYFYAVPVVDGYEFPAEIISTINVLKLTPPVISNVESTCSSITLTFDSVQEYSSYTVYSVTVLYGYTFYSELATVTEPEYVVEDVNIGEEYRFVVSGIVGGLESDKSDYVAATPNHMEKNMPMLDATCTNDGYTAYVYCDYCDTVLSGKDVIGAIGHRYVLTEAEIPATTTSVGKTAVYTCSSCGDSYGGEEIPMLEAPKAPTLSIDTSKDTYFIINATAKDDYQGIKVYFSTDGEEFELLADSAADIVSGNVYAYNHKSLTVGVTYYYYAVGYNGIGESEPSATVSEMYAYVPDPKVISLSAKCTGNEVVFSSAIKHDSILVLRSTNNSQFTYHASIVGNTYTDEAVVAGITYYYKFIGVINGVSSSRRAAEYTFSTKHDEVSYGWVLATCTEDGHSGYSICNYCNEYIREKVIYPATGHSYEETEKEIPATSESAGKTAVYTCSSCGDSYGGDEIPRVDVVGDANGDGKVNMLDVLRTLKAVANGDAEINSANADMDGDGELTVLDVLAIIKTALDN